MDVARRLGAIGSLLGDHARARMLTALLDGRAHTATELAWWADVAPSTASSHLKKLERAALVAVERQGRHRYFRLAGTEVAAALEALLRIETEEPSVIRTGPEDERMRLARTCYDHLAGRLAVTIKDRFGELDYLVEQKDAFDLTPAGEGWMNRMGIDVAAARAQRRKFAPRCLDWSERRPHLAGALGSAVLTMLESRKVVRLEPGTRQVHILPAGRRWLARHLQVSV